MMLHHPTLARRPSHGASFARAAAVACLLAVPVLGGAQVGAGVARAARLEPTSKVELAISEFNAGLHDISNVQPARGVAHLRRALDADPALGIARVFHAMSVPGLTRAEREAELDRGVSDATRASNGELLVATATRARFRGDFLQAQTLLRSAAMLLPDDPNVAYQLALVNGQVPGNSFVAQIAPLRTITTRFPDYGPAHNILAYNLWRTGDRAGAMRSIKMYVEKAPNEPNSHDSYAELLQWNGRLDDALLEYRRALQLDPTFTVASLGIAEVYTLQGRFDLARGAIVEAIPRLTVPAQKVAYQRQIAHIFFLEGDTKGLRAQVATVSAEAMAANQPAVASGGHLVLAINDALVGDAKGVASHLSMVGTEGPAIDRAYLSGFAYALAKQNTQARASLDELHKALTGNTDVATARYAPTVLALVLLNEGKASEAAAEISKTDLATPITRAVLALVEQQRGNVGTARSLRDEVLGDRMLNLDNGALMTARRLVRRIN